MTSWSPLRAGDTVAVIAPAGPLPSEQLAAGLALLRERYRVQLHQPKPASGCAPFLAATDDQRATAFVEALAAPEVKALLCGRGGYGAARLVAELDRRGAATRLASRRLPLVGFSDITALHCWAATASVATVHGPVVTQLSKLPPEQLTALFALLEEHQPPAFEQLDCVVAGRAEGTLLGGNLTVLSHLCGTPYLPSIRPLLLLLEDVGEAPYRIDRMLTQLRQCRFFDHVSGVVLGEFIDCDDSKITAREVLAERLGDLGVPVVAGAPIGHGARNIAVPLGVPAELDAGAGMLRFEDHP